MLTTTVWRAEIYDPVMYQTPWVAQDSTYFMFVLVH